MGVDFTLIFKFHMSSMILLHKLNSSTKGSGHPYYQVNMIKVIQFPYNTLLESYFNLQFTLITLNFSSYFKLQIHSTKGLKAINGSVSCAQLFNVF